jgi:hypothetical protein
MIKAKGCNRRGGRYTDPKFKSKPIRVSDKVWVEFKECVAMESDQRISRGGQPIGASDKAEELFKDFIIKIKGGK